MDIRKEEIIEVTPGFGGSSEYDKVLGRVLETKPNKQD